jgi:hypothetical protein
MSQEAGFHPVLIALMILPAAMVVRMRVNRARRDVADGLKSSTNNDAQ